MNIQIEHVENHLARLTVEVDSERFTKSMEKAARRIANKINIPGFRKGKAPFAVVVKYVGQQAVIEETIDELGNEIYREALTESKIEPYAPGTLDDVKTEPNLQLTFSVPKVPEVVLGSYRDFRLPFTVPEVEDQAVTDAMKRMQENRAIVETVTRPAQLEDIVKVKIYGEVTHPPHEDHVHEEEAETEDEGEAPEAEARLETPEESSGEAEHGHEHQHDHDAEGHTETFIDEEIELLLTEDREREFLPGFAAHIVGMNVGEAKSFTLSYPADYENQRYAGHSYSLRVEVLEVKSRTLPALNDDFARQVTEGEIDNLLELRMRVRKDLQEIATREAESKYADEVLNKLTEQATVRYPEAMVEDYTTDILNDLDRNLRERGLSLKRAMQIQNKDERAMRAEYRDTAITRLKRGLVLRELIKLEELELADAEVDAHIDSMAARFSSDAKEAANFKRMLNQADTRRNIAFDLVMNRLSKRLVQIARGENPPIGPTPDMVLAAPAAEAETSPIPSEALSPEPEPPGEGEASAAPQEATSGE